jgi:hypothetical protein
VIRLMLPGAIGHRHEELVGERLHDQRDARPFGWVVRGRSAATLLLVGALATAGECDGQQAAEQQLDLA